ncbi:MAG: hypothetical protein M1389_04105 [Chloroflexi bacterium]|nr:hypothetical protein [Chloroflexota bacterium]
MAMHRVRAKWLIVLATIGVALLLAASGVSAAPDAAVGSTLFVQADVVYGTVNLAPNEMPTTACVQSSRFAHNQELVFRIRVIDPATGEAMDDQALQWVGVLFPDGDNMLAKYGKHGDDSFWTVSWTVPPDYPTGTLDFQINAVGNDGRTGSFIPFNVASSLVSITDAVHPVVTKQ